jgi:hypothetical protein
MAYRLFFEMFFDRKRRQAISLPPDLWDVRADKLRGLGQSPKVLSFKLFSLAERRRQAVSLSPDLWDVRADKLRGLGRSPKVLSFRLYPASAKRLLFGLAIIFTISNFVLIL